MGATAVITDDWVLMSLDAQAVVRNNEDVQRDSSGNVIYEEKTIDAVTVKLPKKYTRREQRSHFILTQRRKLVGLTSFTEDTGDTASTFSFAIGPSASLTYSSTGKKWVCTQDSVTVSEFQADCYEQTQRWEHFGRWVEIDDADLDS